MMAGCELVELDGGLRAQVLNVYQEFRDGLRSALRVWSYTTTIITALLTDTTAKDSSTASEHGSTITASLPTHHMLTDCSWQAWKVATRCCW